MSLFSSTHFSYTHSGSSFNDEEVLDIGDESFSKSHRSFRCGYMVEEVSPLLRMTTKWLL